MTIVCFAALQLQDGSGILRQRARFAAHCPWPVLKMVYKDSGVARSHRLGGKAEGVCGTEVPQRGPEAEPRWRSGGAPRSWRTRHKFCA